MSLAKKHKISVNKTIYPQIYSYTLPNRSEYDGVQKIGYTERLNVDTRIKEQVQTAAFSEEYQKLWSAPAFFEGDKEVFKDHQFHSFLRKSGIKNHTNVAKEAYYFNGTPDLSKKLFDTFRKQGVTALQDSVGKQSYQLREEQEEAVEKAEMYFSKHENGEFLWNAKPRFGKTLATYDLIKRIGSKNGGGCKALIVTNRPAIANSWYDDYDRFIDGYTFISETTALKDTGALSREDFQKNPKPNIITFLSLQDLKGSHRFGGPHKKLDWIADIDWDILVIDEAHEGIDTDRTDRAFLKVKRKQTLHLSGTPFKALANNKFSADAIYNWTYLDEQRKKQAELEKSESGPHSDIPQLVMHTYRMSAMTAQQLEEGVEINGENHDYSFDLNEFFRTEKGKFAHEEDVKCFLDNLTQNTKYPFSTQELRDELRHTFWYVGNRVDSVKALAKLLKQHSVFKTYEIVVAAGDGIVDDEEHDFKSNEKSYAKVKNAVKNKIKTITLSCGQLTTGVTIKEWSAVLMLTDIKSESLYMQAAFRAQNPYRYYRHNELVVKENAYLFDFSPARVLGIYDTFANQLNPLAVNGEITEKDRKDNVKELLNYFPVISEDVNGEMVELDVEKVLSFPGAIKAQEIVNAQFMSNLLFNSTISSVFKISAKMQEAMNKLNSLDDKKKKSKKEKEIPFDDTRDKINNKEKRIDTNADLLGEKIYNLSNLGSVIEKSTDQHSDNHKALKNIADDIAKPVVEKYVEMYPSNKREQNGVQEVVTEKILKAVGEYEHENLKDQKIKQSLEESLQATLERLSHEIVESKEDEETEEVKKTTEEEIKDRLRAFTRTIPIFVMANSGREKITIDNFDEEVSDEDFKDITNITKEEFHLLRDGCNDIDPETGEIQRYEGVFDRYAFNASIAEFVDKKKKRAHYFTAKEDIFELIPNQKNNQVFTPKNVVVDMINALQKEVPDIFERTDSTFFDLYMKSGLYITEIVKRLFKSTRKHYANDKECVQHILQNQVYGLAPTGVLHSITNEFIFGFDDVQDVDRGNFKHYDLLDDAKNNTVQQTINRLFGKGGTMKFDAVVGNPPYNVNDNGKREDGASNASASPLYHFFVEAAKSLNPRVVSMIIPAKWLSGAGKGLSMFTQNMVSDKSIKSLTLFQDGKKVFQNVDIKGGVCYFVRDSFHHGVVNITVFNNDGRLSSERTLDSTGSNIFIPFAELASIFDKVKQDVAHRSFQGEVSFRKPYGLSTDFFKNPAKYSLPAVYDQKQSDEDLEILGLDGLKRSIRYIPKSYPLPLGEETIGKWKVFIPYAYGCGAIGEVMPTPILGKPIQACTETFLRIGMYENKTEAEAVLKYIKTCFFRALVGILKITQHATKTFKFVPIQDFTKNSDIDWSQSVENIDQQLYKKYQLTDQEIDFIETKIKPMD